MNHRFACALGTLSILAACPMARAGGSFNPGYGSQAQPRAGAFVAKADDPSAAFHNPAGLAKITGTVIQIGINLVNFRQTFQREGTYEPCLHSNCPDSGLNYTGDPYPKVTNQGHGVALGDYSVLPLISAASDLGLDLPIVFSAALLVPGTGANDREYAPDYTLSEDPDVPPPPGRYDTIRQEVVILQPSLAVGYRASDKVDLGVRVSWGYADIKAESATWGLENFQEWEGLDSDFALDVQDKFVPSFGFGVLARPFSFLEVGANYRSASSIKAKGFGVTTSGSGLLVGGEDFLGPIVEPPFRCGAGGDATRFVTCVDLTLPQMASLGARWILRGAAGDEVADVELDIQWEDWSEGDETKIRLDAQAGRALETSIVRHGFQDVLSVRLGGSYTHALGNHKLSARAGAAYDTAAAPVSWTRLDKDGFARTTLGTGLAYELPGWRFELSGGMVLEGTRTVDHGGCNPDSRDLGCNNVKTPVPERDAPDPSQPLWSPGNQAQSPFNAGVYKQSYIFFGTGLTASF